MDRLERYRAKRDFDRTPEPHHEGAASPDSASGASFVVQRHQAQRLHYDLRLELDGVLVSWAVPKGPTLDPGVRRLAVRVEDHPLDYLRFEGEIPRGEYGAGSVSVWDVGEWLPVGDGTPQAQLDAGTLHFDLHGHKLRGRFVLTRTGRSSGDADQWLLLKKDDDEAVPGWETADHDDPVPSVAQWHGPTEDELAALDAMGSAGAWSFDGVELGLTNLDKVLFPAGAGRGPFTKRDLVRHYSCIAPWLLPYLEQRPVNLQRFPNGVEASGFWQKNLPSNAPDWLGRWHDDAAKPGRTEWYSVIDRPAALAWMANLGVIELHPWTSRLASIDRPSWALIDIDPGTSTTFDDVLVMARLFRTALAHLGIEGRPKVTGQRGVQIWVPVTTTHTFEQTRTWVEAVSRSVASIVPELVSWSWRTDERGGLARLDYTQNAHHKTLVAPWSVRPAPGAPVSVPLEWEELDDPGLRPDRWGIDDVMDRVRERGDPLASLIGRPQQLSRF